MKPEDRLVLLARHGRAEIPPTADVTEGVIRALTARPVEPAFLPERLWMWMAGVSCTAAALVTIAAIPFCGLWNDPLAEVVEAISWVMQ
jgi:hypothetical protein